MCKTDKEPSKIEIIQKNPGSRKLGEGPNQWHKRPVIFRGGHTGKEITLAWGGHEKMLTLPLAGESYVTLWRHLESDGRSLSSSL